MVDDNVIINHERRISKIEGILKGITGDISEIKEGQKEIKNDISEIKESVVYLRTIKDTILKYVSSEPGAGNDSAGQIEINKSIKFRLKDNKITISMTGLITAVGVFLKLMGVF